MSNMFNKRTEFGGAFKANEMVLTFAGFGAGYLITSVQASYNIDVQRLRELGSTRTYYVEGDSSGTLNLSRITGPGSAITSLIRAYSDVCSIPQNVISLSFAPGKCGAFQGGEPGITFNGVMINQWGVQASSTQAMIATNTLAGTFESLESDDDGGLAGGLNSASNLAGAAGL